MKRENKREHVSYGVIGLGRFGTALAVQLASRGREVLVLDADEDRVAAIRQYTENAFVVRNLDKVALEETGIQNCDVAVVCVGEKMDTSILTTLHLKALGVPRVISKANSPEHGEILKKLGAEVVYPEQDMAIRLAERLEPMDIQDLADLSEDILVSMLQAPRAAVGRSVAQLDLRRRYGLNIVALRRDGRVLTDITPETVLRESDFLYVVGDHEEINRFTQFPG